MNTLHSSKGLLNDLSRHTQPGQPASAKWVTLKGWKGTLSHQILAKPSRSTHMLHQKKAPRWGRKFAICVYHDHMFRRIPCGDGPMTNSSYSLADLCLLQHLCSGSGQSLRCLLIRSSQNSIHTNQVVGKSPRTAFLHTIAEGAALFFCAVKHAASPRTGHRFQGVSFAFYV